MTGPTTDEMQWAIYDQTGRLAGGLNSRDVVSAGLANLREGTDVWFISEGGDAEEDQGPFRLSIARDAD